MNWKEQLRKGDLSFLSHNWITNKKHNRESFSAVVEDFISTEIIEKLIADISESPQIVVLRKDTTELTDEVERKNYFEQLRDKWL